MTDDKASNEAHGPSLEDVMEYIERAKGGATRRVAWDELSASLDELTEGYPCIVQIMGTEAKVGRARNIGKGEKIENLGQLGPPPPEMCRSAGRCNWIGKPNAYLGVGTELALSEINARIGDRVGLIHVKPTRDMYLMRIGAIDLYRRTNGQCDLDDRLKSEIGRLPKDRNGIRAHLIDAFIADFFSRPGHPDVYRLTSAIGRVFFDAFPKLDGIMYDSVNHVRGACIAMRTDSYQTMLPTEAQIINITGDLGYGIYDFEEESFADNFDGSNIAWRNRS